MKSVFIGGSRQIINLPEIVQARINNIIKNNLDVFIGDANGADKSVQKYLLSLKYENITIYCSGTTCRNNMGKWQEVHVQTSRRTKDRLYYEAKDIQMAQAADCGFMLWDEKSSGTLNNIINLLDRNKICVVYSLLQNDITTLRTFSDLEAKLKTIPEKSLTELDKKIDCSKKIAEKINRSKALAQNGKTSENSPQLQFKID